MPITTGLGSTGDIYAELGVTPLVNVNGTATVIGGSVMKPEVKELIRRGNEHFVLIDELEIAAGRFIAKLCKSPAGYTGLLTGGAADNGLESVAFLLAYLIGCALVLATVGIVLLVRHRRGEPPSRSRSTGATSTP